MDTALIAPADVLQELLLTLWVLTSLFSSHVDQKDADIGNNLAALLLVSC